MRSRPAAAGGSRRRPPDHEARGPGSAACRRGLARTGSCAGARCGPRGPPASAPRPRRGRGRRAPPVPLAAPIRPWGALGSRARVLWTNLQVPLEGAIWCCRRRLGWRTDSPRAPAPAPRPGREQASPPPPGRRRQPHPPPSAHARSAPPCETRPAVPAGRHRPRRPPARPPRGPPAPPTPRAVPSRRSRAVVAIWRWSPSRSPSAHWFDSIALPRFGHMLIKRVVDLVTCRRNRRGSEACRPIEAADLLGTQRAVLPGGEAGQPQRPDGGAYHPPPAGAGHHPCAFCPGQTVVELDPLLEAPHRVPGQTLDLSKVPLLDAVARMGKAVGEVAVIGEQDQPLGVPVQPADRDHPRVLWHHLDHRRPALRVIGGAHHSQRLVQHPVAQPLVDHDPRAVDLDPIGGRVDPPAHLLHDLAVDRHPSGTDQLLDRPPGPKARRTQRLVEPQPLAVLGPGAAGPAWWRPRTGRRSCRAGAAGGRTRRLGRSCATRASPTRARSRRVRSAGAGGTARAVRPRAAGRGPWLRPGASSSAGGVAAGGVTAAGWPRGAAAAIRPAALWLAAAIRPAGGAGTARPPRGHICSSRSMRSTPSGR